MKAKKLKTKTEIYKSWENCKMFDGLVRKDKQKLSLLFENMAQTFFDCQAIGKCDIYSFTIIKNCFLAGYTIKDSYKALRYIESVLPKDTDVIDENTKFFNEFCKKTSEEIISHSI